MYVEYVERCTMEAFLDCHIHAFRHLGGVPAEILYGQHEKRGDQPPGWQGELQHRVSAFCPSLRLHAQGLPAIQPMGQGQGGAADGLYPGALLAGLRLHDP